MFIVIRYHGSVTQAHGIGLLIGIDGDDRYHLRVPSGDLHNTRRESFTILDDDPNNMALDAQFREVSA